MDCALAMIRRNHSVSRTCRLLRVARSRVNVLLKRTNDWKDHCLAYNRSNNQLQDNNLQQEIQEALARHSSFGYKRLTAVINRKRQKVNHPRVNCFSSANLLCRATRRSTTGKSAWMHQINGGVRMDWSLSVSMVSMYR